MAGTFPALVLMAALLLPAHRAGAVIYRYVDRNGVIHFSDVPSRGAHRVKSYYRPLLVRAKPLARMRASNSPRLSDARPGIRPGIRPNVQMDSLIKKESREYGLDPSLVRAVIRAESGFDCTAVSPKGAMGLMQLMPKTAASLGVCDPFDPADNISGGARYLSRLLTRFGGNLPLALAAYNAGPQAIEQWGSIPPYPETRSYIRRVLVSYRMGTKGGGPGLPGNTRLRKIRRATVIYRIRLPGGEVLYTNDPPGF